MNPFTPLRRHPYLWLSGLLLAGVAVWIGYFLATFDLDRYHEQIARELGRRLRMPVRLGKAHLELREAGVAFRFTELRIGTEQTPSELHAETLWLQLAWHGLLLKKPIFTEIALDRPQLRITLPPPQPEESPPPTPGLDLELLRGLQVKRIEVHQGGVTLNRAGPAGSSRTVSLTDLEIEIDRFGLNKTVTFNGTGDLNGQTSPARLAINGSVQLPATGTLRNTVWDLALDTRGLDANQVVRLLSDDSGTQAEGTADLELFLKGSLDREVTVQAKLTGTRLSFKPGAAIQNPVPIKQLQLTGSWQQQEGRQQFRQVELQFNDLRLAGEFSVSSSDGGHQVTGQLGHSTLPLDTLHHWVPPALQATNPIFSRRLPGGLITLSHARFFAEIPAGPQSFSGLTLNELNGEAKGLSWDLGRERKAELQSMVIRLENDRWHFEQGSGTIAGLQGTLSATVFTQSDGQPQFSLDFAINGPSGQFAALHAQPLPAELTVAGDLELQGHLAGTPALYSFDLSADLARLEAHYGDQLHLPPTPGSRLAVRGQGTPTTLSIEQGDLALAVLTGRLTGTVDWATTLSANLSARVQLPDLTRTYDYAPALGKLQVRGGAAADIAAVGPLAALEPKIILDLVDVAIPTHGHVADISQLNGRLRLEGRGVRSEKLTARLGTSPVTLKARVADLGAPRLELEVQAPVVRADELIFRSDRMVLRDLDGRLIFDRDGLYFAPVKVRLDGGTRATVSGSLKNFAKPQVALDITGDYANVKEIIGLWTDETPAAAAARHARRAATAGAPLPPIRITVDAREGELYGMKFSGVKALIVPTSGQLLIQPLNFYVGEGYCSAQVLVDHSGKDSVLRVSGHVENVDAYAIVNELLGRKSIMRGSLRGDFSLQGELGERGFLPTSHGNLNLSVHDGVMRHSPVLSTLFSVLNISQLFKFQLPDVNREGVPFTLLTTEISIDKGIVKTEYLVIDSEAMDMSYVGQYDMVSDRLDLLVVVKPLGTVDKVVTHLPIAGWILGGEERALVTAHFQVTGTGAKPKIEAIPITAMSKGVLGIFQRTLSLPIKLIEDPAILWGGGGERK